MTELWDGSQPVVWVCNPSARPAAEVWAWLTAWIRRGYGACIYRDTLDDELIHLVKASGAPIILLSGTPYPGYAIASNSCIKEVCARVPKARWFICTGDDTDCDKTWHPNHIALQLEAHFGNSTFGVCQPVGDRWQDAMGPIIDRICGSGWYGKEYCRRLYRGNGPLWHEFTHMHVDQHAREVALKLGVYLERQDVAQVHRHFTRPGDQNVVDWEMGRRNMPPHLVKWNSREHWNQSLAIFERLQAGGFAEAFDLLPEAE